MTAGMALWLATGPAPPAAWLPLARSYRHPSPPAPHLAPRRTHQSGTLRGRPQPRACMHGSQGGRRACGVQGAAGRGTQSLAAAEQAPGLATLPTGARSSPRSNRCHSSNGRHRLETGQRVPAQPGRAHQLCRRGSRLYHSRTRSRPWPVTELVRKMGASASACMCRLAVTTSSRDRTRKGRLLRTRGGRRQGAGERRGRGSGAAGRQGEEGTRVRGRRSRGRHISLPASAHPPPAPAGRPALTALPACAGWRPASAACA